MGICNSRGGNLFTFFTLMAVIRPALTAAILRSSVDTGATDPRGGNERLSLM